MNTKMSIAAMVALTLLLALPASVHAAEANTLEPLKIELPEASNQGTPCEHWSPNLEPEEYKERPPLLVPQGTALLSKGKPVAASAKEPVLGGWKQVTDGDKRFENNSLVELDSGVQWVQVDLQEERAIQAVLIWHAHKEKRVYFDLVVQLASDADFKTGVTTIYNNDYDNSSGLGVGKDKEYIENNRGRLMKVDGVKARFVRCYSNGNSANPMNNYVEVEVFGK